MKNNWNTCNVCGKFISFEDFANGEAIRKLETPDSEISKEKFITLCKKHKSNENT